MTGRGPAAHALVPAGLPEQPPRRSLPPLFNVSSDGFWGGYVHTLHGPALWLCIRRAMLGEPPGEECAGATSAASMVETMYASAPEPEAGQEFTSSIQAIHRES